MRLYDNVRLRLIIGLLFLADTAILRASSIDLSIVDAIRVGAPGDLETFEGTITNDTGAALDSTDLFLNFSGYDPVNVILNQTLGDVSFPIPNGSTSAVVSLFTFALAATAPVPASFPSDVVLETASGAIAPTETVIVNTLVPEPSSLALALTAGFALLAGASRKLVKLLVLTVFLIGVGTQVSRAQVSAVQFITTTPGLGDAGANLLVALPIKNTGTVSAANVQVTAVSLRTATLVTPTAFPVALGAVAAGQSVVFQASFDAAGLSQNAAYLLTVRGTYQVGGVTAGFTVNRFIELPPASPGSATLKIGSVSGTLTTGGPFPPQPPAFDDDVNAPRPPVPIGPFVPVTKTPNGTVAFQPNGIQVKPQVEPQAAVVFNSNTATGLTSAGLSCSPGTAPSTCAEPSGASGGGVIFITANWIAAYSTNGGGLFTQVDPTTVFPNDAVGFCCDQVVQYVPSINRFIWVLQGNGYRLASASPSQIIKSGGIAWTHWNLTPDLFGQPSGTGFDYPDVSVGTNNLYISWDTGFPNCPAGCNSGREIMRIPLSQIAAGGTINFEYTTPSDSSSAWGSHLSQDTGNEIFWAGQEHTSALRVFSLTEGSNTYYWRTVGISSWSNTGISSSAPDGHDWFSFGFPGTSVIGATRSSNEVWFAWTAGTDNNFSQPHVEMVSLNINNNFHKDQQVQIWNNSYAFGYPALATNGCTGEVGLSLDSGGSANYPNHVVGFWGDFVVYPTTNSNTSSNRFGDYVTIRQDNSNNALMDALGYGLTSTEASGVEADVQYVVFGRSCGNAK